MAAPVNITEATQELAYVGKRSALYATGKETALHIGAEIGSSAGNGASSEVARTAGAAAVGLGPTIGMVVGVGLAAGISAGLTQMDFNHKRKRIIDVYKDELSSKTGKEAGKITIADLENVAKGDPAKGQEGNAVLAEELHRAKKQRNYGLALSVISTVATIGIMTAVFAPAMPAIVGGMGLVAGTFAAKAAAIAVGSAVSLLTYNAVKQPLHWVADKLFSLDDKTTNDKIIELKRNHESGGKVTQEQVVGVFASANKRLDATIMQQYGTQYEDMALTTKQQVTADLGKSIDLQKITDDINLGKVNVTELAFLVDGQISGVMHTSPVPPRKLGMIENVVERARGMFARKHEEPVQGSALLPSTVTNPLTYDNAAPEKSFVSRLGRDRMDNSISHVERVEQTRPDPTIGLNS